MKKTTLSIVVPHYNVAQYIDCLYMKLFPQITSKVELLLIEDCSTDTTKEKMQQYENTNKNENISFIYLEQNLGLSGARNRGVSLAKGEYIWFIDSDDFIDPNSIKTILNIIHSLKPTGIVFDFCKFFGNDGKCHDSNKNIPNLQYSKTRSLPKNILVSDKYIRLNALFDDAQMYVWCYIIQTKYWKQFPFPEGKKFEDVTVMPMIIYNIDTLYYLEEPLYYYRKRDHSILSAPTVESCFDMSNAMQEVSKYFQSKNLPEVSQISLYTFYLKMLRLSYGNMKEHHLFSNSSLKQFQESEHYFLKALPWNKYQFISKMKMYTIFKFTSFLFLSNKHIYTFVKNLLGKY
jgi:glycosyltransferase involved in cell wall biosynthesis